MVGGGRRSPPLTRDKAARREGREGGKKERGHGKDVLGMDKVFGVRDDRVGDDFDMEMHGEDGDLSKDHARLLRQEEVLGMTSGGAGLAGGRNSEKSKVSVTVHSAGTVDSAACQAAAGLQGRGADKGLADVHGQGGAARAGAGAATARANRGRGCADCGSGGPFQESGCANCAPDAGGSSLRGERAAGARADSGDARGACREAARASASASASARASASAHGTIHSAACAGGSQRTSQNAIPNTVHSAACAGGSQRTSQQAIQSTIHSAAGQISALLARHAEMADQVANGDDDMNDDGEDQDGLVKANNTQKGKTESMEGLQLGQGMFYNEHDMGDGRACCPGHMDEFSGGDHAEHPKERGEADQDVSMEDDIAPRQCTQGACTNAKENPSTFAWGVLQGLNKGKGKATTNPLFEDNSLPREALPRTSNGASSRSREGKDQANPWKKKEYVKLGPVDKNAALMEDGITILLDDQAVDDNQVKLERALVGKVLGRRPPYFYLNADLQRKWSRWGAFKLIMVAPDCFVCIFETTEARDAVLMNGPWIVAGNVIGLDKWTPTFNPKSFDGLSSPIWVRFPNLPLLYWDNTNIARIASFIGEPLWVDHPTNSWGQSMFARVCIRLDLSQKLPPGVWIHGRNGRFFQRVEYEGITQLCFACGKVGHKVDSCPTKRVPPAATTQGKTFAPSPVQTNVQKSMQNLAQPATAEKGECSTTNQNPTNGKNAETQQTTSPPLPTQPEESISSEYGQWVLVTRKKRTNNKQQQINLKKKEGGKQGHRSGQPTATQPPGRAPLQGAPPKQSLPTAEASLAPIFQAKATVEKLKKPVREKATTQPTTRSRMSQAHFEREVQNLGPIEANSKKRKKTHTESPAGGDKSPMVT